MIKTTKITSNTIVNVFTANLLKIYFTRTTLYHSLNASARDLRFWGYFSGKKRYNR